MFDQQQHWKSKLGFAILPNKTKIPRPKADVVNSYLTLIVSASRDVPLVG